MGPGGPPQEDLGPGISVLGGLFLLFVLENLLGFLRHQRPRTVSGAPCLPLCPDQWPALAESGLVGLGVRGQCALVQALVDPWEWGRGSSAETQGARPNSLFYRAQVNRK